MIYEWKKFVVSSETFWCQWICKAWILLDEELLMNNLSGIVNKIYEHQTSRHIEEMGFCDNDKFFW